MPETILVTGGNGFLGHHIVEHAENKGYNVLAPRSREFNLETGEGIQQYLTEAKQAHGSIDTIIHSAAYYGGIGINQKEPATMFQKNIRMALNIFEAAKDLSLIHI